MAVTITDTAGNPISGPVFTQAAAQASRERRVVPGVAHSPGMVRTRPSDAELAEQRRAEERRRLEARRPADRSSAAVQYALDAVTADLATAERRLTGLRDDATDLLGKTPEQVRTVREAAELAAIEVEQLTEMAAGLRSSLAEAQEREAEEVAALLAHVPAAKAKVAAWRKFIDRDYPELAAKLAAGLALEAEAEAARTVLVRASDHRPGAPFPEPLPRVEFFGWSEPYRRRANLPGTMVQAEAKWEPMPSAPRVMNFG